MNTIGADSNGKPNIKIRFTVIVTPNNTLPIIPTNDQSKADNVTQYLPRWYHQK